MMGSGYTRWTTPPNASDVNTPNDPVSEVARTVLGALGAVAVAFSAAAALYDHIGWWGGVVGGGILLGWAELAELVAERRADRRGGQP